MNYKYLMILFFLCTSILVQAQDRTYSYKKVYMIEFKEGQKNEGMNIGEKYFGESLKALGVEVELYESLSGKWDAIIILESDKSTPFEDPYATEFQALLRKVAGSDQQFRKDIDRYNDSILHQETHYFKKWVY